MRIPTRHLLWLIISLLCVPLAAQVADRDHMPYRDELAPEIKFWKMVFARVSEHQNLIHDSEHLDIVYKTVTFDTSVSPKLRARKLKALKKDLSDQLLSFHHSTYDSSRMSAADWQVYHKFDHIKDKDKFLTASKRVRSQQGIMENFKAGIERSYAYLPYLKKVFAEEGVPQELIYLPHIESSFNPSAVSHVGAAGMWQFMRATARQFMKVNRIKDERFDPLVSTRAAARLLKSNYRVIKDWALAITAYNHGLGSMKKAKRRFGPNYMKIRESYLRRSFGFASKNFYPEFLAAVEIMDSLSYYFPQINKDPVFIYAELRLPEKMSMKTFAQEHGFELSELQSLNPGFKSYVWRGIRFVPAGYTIRLPVGSDVDQIMAKLESGSASSASQLAAVSKPEASSGPPLLSTNEFLQRGNQAQQDGVEAAFPVAARADTRALSDTSGLAAAPVALANNVPVNGFEPWHLRTEAATAFIDMPAVVEVAELAETSATPVIPDQPQTVKPVELAVADRSWPLEPTSISSAIRGQTLADRPTALGAGDAIDSRILYLANDSLREEEEAEFGQVLAALPVDPDPAVSHLRDWRFEHAGAAYIAMETKAVQPTAEPVETDDPSPTAVGNLASSDRVSSMSVGIPIPLNDLPSQQTPVPANLAERFRPLALQAADDLGNTDEWIAAALPQNDISMTYPGATIPTGLANSATLERDVSQDAPILAEGFVSMPSGGGRPPRQIAPGYGEVRESLTVAAEHVLNRQDLRTMLRERLQVQNNGVVVFPQETMGHFSDWLNTSVTRLARSNNAAGKRQIYMGQRLNLDFSRVSQGEFLEKRVNYHAELIEDYLNNSAGFKLVDHQIRPGDNLWNLARKRYNFPVNLLLYFNDLDKLERLYPGDVIKLPIKYN